MTKNIEGYIIKYNRPSKPFVMPNGKRVYEIIPQDAFKQSVDDINAGKYQATADLEHETDALNQLGITGSNLTLENRPDGVFMRMSLLPDSNISDELFARIRAGVVKGLSINAKFNPTQEPSYKTVNGDYIRTMPSPMELRGFAITADPAYPDAQVSVAEGSFKRSLSAAEITQLSKEIEAIERTRYYNLWGFALGVR